MTFLISKIKQSSLEARKNKDAVLATLLVTLYSEAATVGKNAGNRETTDAETVAVVKKFIKGIDETLIALKEDTASIRYKTALAERAILETFLPKQLTAEQLSAVIAELVKNSTALTMQTVMKTLKEQYSGCYDGALASKLVKEMIK